jgi:hypothetical protein
VLRKRIRIQALKLSSHFDISSVKTASKINLFNDFFYFGEEQLPYFCQFKIIIKYGTGTVKSPNFVMVP